MCGIVGYVGKNPAKEILLDGLTKLEYRGYDSAGIALRNKASEPVIIKAEGILKNLIDKVNAQGELAATSGIAHTRWATHGSQSEINAHPHSSSDNFILGVHNGIIENFHELIEKLLHNGYKFYSDTDTEVLIKLVDYYYKKYKVGPVDAINKVMVRARGSFALALMFKDFPDEVWFAKKGSPLIVGKSQDGCYLASDIPAILKHTNEIYYVEDFQCGCLKEKSITFYDLNGDDVTSSMELKTIEWKASDTEKGNYPFYMIKEIEEQPKAVWACLNVYTKNDLVDFEAIGLTKEYLSSLDNIYILGCGSAYNVGKVSECIIEELTNCQVRVELASEFKYRSYKLNKNSLAIIISQSGETKDSYEALLKCKNEGIKTLSIVNVKGSVIPRNSDYHIYTYAGPEIAVATTKAYSSQLLVMYLFSLALAEAKEDITIEDEKKYIKELKSLPEKMEHILSDKTSVQKLANHFVSKKDVFFIGREMDYAISEEGSLKFKEVTYIHSEAKPSGELKHGTLSLVTDGVPVIAIATQPELLEKSISNMEEVKSRGASVIALTMEGADVSKSSKYQIYIPKTNKLFTASLAIIYLQLLAYYVSIAKGINPDQPRNLAKSVTVE